MPVTPVATGGGGTGGEVGTEGGSELDAPGVEDATAINEPQTRKRSAPSPRPFPAAPPCWPTNRSTSASSQPPAPAPATIALPASAAAAAAASAAESAPAPAPVETRAPASLAAKFASSPPTSRNTANGSTYFHIELGVLGQDNKVYYVYNLSQDKPDVRVGDPTKEQRLYMNPTDSQFAALDRQLAVKAGAADKGRIILQFYPPEAQAILVDLEQKRAGARKPEEIRSTVFRVTHRGSAFEFSVEDQTYR